MGRPMKRSSIYSPEHRVMVGLLRDLRLEAGLSQLQVGEALNLPQTKVSAVEIGRRGLDYLQVREFVELYGLSMAKFALMLDDRIAGAAYRPPRRPRRDQKAKPPQAAAKQSGARKNPSR